MSYSLFGLYSVCLVAGSALADAKQAPVAVQAEVQNSRSQVLQDVWIDARLETAYLLNRHLNNFTIQTHVDQGRVMLTGTVASDIDKDLAAEIAKGVRGVKSVENHLVLKAGEKQSEVTVVDDQERQFGELVDDVTTTARVKTNLVKNKNIKGLKIDVDTRNSVVTLSGQVASAEQKQLAEFIAKNTSDVKAVHNRLQVAS